MAGKRNLTTEVERLRIEYEQMLATVTTAEHEHAAERRRLAGQEALGELSPEEATLKRATLDSDLAAARDKLRVLADAVPEVERRGAEEVEKQRQLRIKQSGDALAKAVQARWNVSKNLSKALREAENHALELERHRGLVSEAEELYRERLENEDFSWPQYADEAWEIRDDVLAVLVGGPIQPIATAQRRVDEEEERRVRQESEVLDWACQQPTKLRLSQIPETLRLHPRVRAAEAAYDEKIAAQKAARAVKREEHDEEQATVSDKKLAEVV